MSVIRTSRIPDTLKALLTLLKPAMAPLPVYYGPPVTQDVSNCLFIAFDGNPEGTYQGVVGDSVWAGLGAKARDENFQVICCIYVITGDDDNEVATERAFTLLGNVETALRADPSLGQAPPFVAGVDLPELYVEPGPYGIQIRLTFRISVKSRI